MKSTVAIITRIPISIITNSLNSPKIIRKKHEGKKYLQMKNIRLIEPGK